jgi:hypothetical protein
VADRALQRQHGVNISRASIKDGKPSKCLKEVVEAEVREVVLNNGLFPMAPAKQST